MEMEKTRKDTDKVVEARKVEDVATSPTIRQGNNNNKKNPQNELEKSQSVRLVIQRFRKASLLIDESRMVSVGGTSDEHSGILVYVSFAKTATREKVFQAATTIMNLPILTRGVWGDGSEPASVLDMAKNGGVAVVLVPQANLISKIKSQGRSIQYHGQIDRSAGEALYDYFVDCIRSIALEQQCSTRNEPIPTWITEFESNKPTKVDASVPPDQVFRDASLYSSWDEAGIPLTNQNGEPLTKSAVKKLKKQYEAHKKRHEKYLKTASSNTTAAEQTGSQIDWSLLDDSFVHIVAGSFGKRQALEIKSDMGPFCHVLNL